MIAWIFIGILFAAMLGNKLANVALAVIFIGAWLGLIGLGIALLAAMFGHPS